MPKQHGAVGYLSPITTLLLCCRLEALTVKFRTKDAGPRLENYFNNLPRRVEIRLEDPGATFIETCDRAEE